MKKALSVVLAIVMINVFVTTAFASVYPLSIGTMSTISSVDIEKNGSANFRLRGTQIGDTFSFPESANFNITANNGDGVVAVGTPVAGANAEYNYYRVTKAGGYMDFTVTAKTGLDIAFGSYLVSYKSGAISSQYKLNQASVNARMDEMNKYFEASNSIYNGALSYSVPPVANNKAALSVKLGNSTINLSEATYSSVPAITPFAFVTAPVTITSAEYNLLAPSAGYTIKRMVNGTEDKTATVGDGTCVYSGTLILDKGIYEEVNAFGSDQSIILNYKATAEPGKPSAHMYIAVEKALELSDSVIRIDARTNQISTITGEANDKIETRYNGKDTFSEANKTWSVTGTGTYNLTVIDFFYFMANNPTGKDLQIIVDNGVFDIQNKDMPYTISKSYLFKLTYGADSDFMWTRVAKASGDNIRPWVFVAKGADFAMSRLSVTVTADWISAYGHQELDLYEFIPVNHNHDNCNILSHYEDRANAIMSELKLEDTRETILKFNIKKDGTYFLSGKKPGSLTEDTRNANPNTGGGNLY